ncbi:hypothetical protein [Actinoplanes derwentensis]|uniref:Uncharacterized protein n=1 Tax=Actinoplanes derwentensis TaxID=113562 RepID=A0A1H2CX80_9ACTN|nr:hypothetical protein [Actinoplanes derwentensis]GID88344.1 hypothetical protein Ade03nite_72680 [Actinoplanes derwentensis]SDT74656.1 hypothetical protein SAMN04489716_7052 [Actinoplanes derwentensis]
MRLRTHAFVALTSATVLALTGCSSSTGASTAAPVTNQAPAATGGAPSSTPTSDPGDGGCPAPAATLEKLMKLDAGFRIDKSSIKCSQGWAVAGIIAADKAQQGDGQFLFKFSDSTETWTSRGEGSSFDCATYDIPKSTGFCS